MSNRYSLGRTTWLRYSWLLLVAFLFSTSVSAQVSAYSFTEGVSSYAPLVGGTAINNGGDSDDGIQGPTNIGFTFNFGGVNYTQFSVNTNGLVKLGGTTIGGSAWTNVISNTATHRPLIAALWDDGNQNTGSITYLTSGTAPNRVFEINFNGVNIGGGGATSATNRVSYSIKIYETTNVVEFDYGSTLATAGAMSASIGINDMTSYRNVTPGVTSTSSTTVLANGINAVTNLVNKKFTFAPPAACSSVTAGGTATTTNATPCYGASFTLNVTGATTNTGVGVTYQWYSSLDNVSFDPIVGANSATLVTSVTTTALYYQRETSCDAGPSDLFSSSILVTPSSSPVSVPYSEDFESLTAFGAGLVPNCMSTQIITGTAFTSANAAVRNGVAARSGTDFVWSRWSSDVVLYTPAINLVGGTSYDFSAYYRNTDPTAGFTLTYYVGTAPNYTGMTSLGTIVNPLNNTTWAEGKYSFTPGTSGVYYFAVRSTAPTSSPWYINWDDFSVIETPACTNPSALNVSAVSETGATLGWTPQGAETLWDVEYGPTGFTQGTGIFTNDHTSASLAITGLTAGTAYQFYVRADCAGTESLWSGPFSFSTLVPGDNCSNVISLDALTSPLNGTTVGASADFSFVCNGNTSPDLIYSITVNAGQVLTIGQTANGYDSENYVFYGGSCPGTTQIACFDDPDVQNISWTNNTGITQTVYWIQDGYFDGTIAGTFTLAWSILTPPPCGITTFPSTESFDGLTETCWSVANVNADADTWVLDGGNPRTGSQSASINTDFNGGANNDYLISDAITLTGNERLNYWYRVQSAGEPNDFEILLSTTDANPASFTTTLMPTTSFSNTTYANNIINLDAFTGTVYIAFRVPPAGLDGWILYLDDITIETIPACPAPTAGAAAAITATSANLSWTAGAAETLWDIEYGPTGFTQGTGTVVSGLTATSYALTGLAGGTAYQVYYRADCGGTQSAWSGPINFSTLPSNDNCSNALDLATLTSPYSSSTVGATNDFTNTCASGNTSPDVVFFIDVPNGFELTIGQTVNGYDSENTVFYGGACPGTTQIACFDDPDIQNVVWGNTTGSTQTVYWVQDGFFGAGDAGTYTLAWSLTALPACGNPTASAVNPVFNGVSFTINAGGLGTPVGYEYEIVADLATPTGVGTSSVTNAISATGLSAVTAYDLYVRTNCGVDGFSAWVGPISFTTPNVPPANDECANAISISCLATPVAGTTVDATVDTYVDAGAGGTLTTQRGVWYVITGDDNQYTINTCSATGYDTRLSVYSGSCGALTPITGNDDLACEFSNFRSQVSFGAFAGTNYYVFVHGYEGGFGLSAVGAFELNISCSALCIPDANDACLNAVELTPASTCVYTAGDTECSTNTVGLANPAGTSGFATYNDIWYTITPTTSDFYLNFAYGTATLLRYTLYTGTCGALVATPVNGIAPEATDLGVFGATVGQTYYLRVGADKPFFGTDGTDGTFDVCVRSLPCSTPTSATVTATSQTNVNVVINGGVAGDAYIIEYGPAGHVPGIDGTAGAGGTIVTTNTLNTNVTVAAEANYTFYVRKDCSGSAEGYSFNVGPYNVSTFLVVPFSGTNTITACGATIYDHAGNANYSDGANGTLVVNPTSGTLLQITGSIDTESGWDFVTIYEGSGTGGTVLYDASGVGTVNVQASAPDVPLTIEFTSDGSGQDVGFQLTTACLTACGSPLIAGTINGPSSACSGQSFTLSMNTQELGRTYQWQVRTSTTSWVNLVGETGPTLTTSQTVARIYRCRVGCAFIGSTATSPSPQFEVPMAPFEQCYCASSYTFGTTDNDAIENVTLGSIDNTSGISASPFITTFAPGVGTTTTLTQGSEVSGSVTVFSDFGGLSVAVWIDFNRNGSYESSERVAQSTASLDGGDTHTFNFIVPPTAQVGTTGMRVRTVWNNGNLDPCTTYGYGETENYTVTIATGSANDARPNAQSIAPAVFPGCSNITGNLANATPTQGEPGNDLWYTFLAGSNAVRIQLVGAQDCEIELEDNLGNVLAAEDATTANGNEVLAFGGLTAGTQYWVAIRSMNSNPSSFSCCIQSLNDSRCDNGPIFTSLCNTFKVDWTGTANYVVRFTETAAPNATYTYNMNGVTSVPLRLITGLEHNRSYNVSVDAVYTVVDAGGNTSTITATSNETCPITITQHPLTNLRGIDRDPATRTIGAFISSDVSVCAATNWEWTFELVDEFGVPNGLEGPVSVLANTTSRFIRTSQIPDVLPGNRYRVRVRPIFASGPGVFDDLSFHYLRIAGTAGMVDVFDNTANPEEVYFERNTENGVFAALYPNPNNGDMVNLNLAGIDSDNVNVRIMDASGRIVWTNRYVVEGALNTIIAFDRPLTSGIYLVEMTFDNQVITERMMVTK